MKTTYMNQRHIILSLFAMAAITQVGFVLYTPAFTDIALSLHLTANEVQSTLTSYLFGFGVAQLFYGPLSDCLGRKKLLLTGLAMFSLGCLWSVFANGYWSLLLSRFVQGLGIASCMTLSRAILRDSFSGKEYVRVASYLSSGFALGLGVSPVIGGHLLDFFSWRSNFIFLFICGVILLVNFSIFLPETKAHNRSELSFKFCLDTLKHFQLILKNVQFLGYLLGGVMAYGVIIAYNTMAPFLFQEALKFSASSYGWLTLIIGCAYYFGTMFNRRLVTRFGTALMIKIGILLVFLSGLVMLVLAEESNNLIVYIIFIPLLVATFAQALIWSNCIAGALQEFPHIAGTAAAFFGCLQMLLSSVVSGIVALPGEQDQIPLAISLIVLAGVSAISFFTMVFRRRTDSR